MVRKKYFAYRTLQTIFLLWLVLTVLFLLFRMLPGDPTGMMVYRGASPETIEAFREKWRLDDPIHVQYYYYLINFLQGDAGTSLANQQPVWDYVNDKILNSFILVAPAITLGYILGTIMGTLFGRYRGTDFENWGLVPVIFFGSIPSFFSAIFMIVIFAAILNLFPTGGMIPYDHVTDRGAPWWRIYFTREFLWHYTLPFVTIVLRYVYSPTLIMRTSVVEVSVQDFIFYHEVTGLSLVDRMRRLMRHAILPVITLYPVSMTRAIGGLVLIEMVFNWPGIGAALVSAVLARDYPVVQFLFFLIAAFVIISNFLVDILYGIIDPRVSVEG